MPEIKRCAKCLEPLGGVFGDSCRSDRCWPETYRRIEEGMNKEEARIVASIARTKEELRRLSNPPTPIEAYEWM